MEHQLVTIAFGGLLAICGALVGAAFQFFLQRKQVTEVALTELRHKAYEHLCEVAIPFMENFKEWHVTSAETSEGIERTYIASMRETSIELSSLATKIQIAVAQAIMVSSRSLAYDLEDFGNTAWILSDERYRSADAMTVRIPATHSADLVRSTSSVREWTSEPNMFSMLDRLWWIVHHNMRLELGMARSPRWSKNYAAAEQQSPEYP